MNLTVENSYDDLSKFPQSSDIISIIVGRIDGSNQLHCGIAYKYHGENKVIHLAWHNLLKDDSISSNYFSNDNYFFIKSSLPELRQQSISAFCRLVLKRKNQQSIPYGLKYEGSPFDKDGVIKLNNEVSGLTCATFVLSIFERCGIELISINSWEKRTSDKIWHESIINNLVSTQQRFNISNNHINNVRKEKGCSRFRPNEVAISSVFENIPEDNDKIIKAAEHLIKLI